MREILSELLTQLTIVPQSNADLELGVADRTFSDFEDSYQFQAAKKADCQYLVTINTKDYKSVEETIEILTPTSFSDKFLMSNQ